MTDACDLTTKSCLPCEGGTPALSQTEISTLLAQLDGWEQNGVLIAKTYRFKDHYQAMAFVNAVAWISHRENHHPDIHLGYNQCRVEYTTHALNGLSENDFICAAKIDALFHL
ncbi:pterin-4-alpha-carbinolamine dehydratase [Sulfuriferula multivorans]|uniref:Putative pterin-4-alpha-carbinolamine dehydratase n=1 Tax=Sulfuriferula multivorans TaxID=1559896 RepID=A0A401JA83_9PROT|nr:4a-hydroxytetrahydrobiopterin dehydratase [Sulfuriferula multivorans]GBL44480.1 pterin-4-alpha-carbinolamine dehydratase [Sulfuriferula multivorans]